MLTSLDIYSLFIYNMLNPHFLHNSLKEQLLGGFSENSL